MSAKRKGIEDGSSSESAAKRNVAAVLFVLVMLVAGIAIALVGFPSGRLFVLVETRGSVVPAHDLVVNVYEGDVAHALRAGNLEDYPQAVASVTLQPGVDTRVEGRWRGTYTLAVVTLQGYAADDASILVVQADKGETHAAFMLAS